MNSVTKTMRQLTAQEFLFGAGDGCWNLWQRSDELKQKLKKTPSLTGQFYELDDCLSDTILRLVSMYGSSLFPGPEPHFYGSFFDSNTKRLEAIPSDPLDFVLRIATNRRTTLCKKRRRELRTHVAVEYYGAPSYLDTAPEELERHEKLREIIAEFHKTESGQQCCELHRLHYNEKLTLVNILNSYGKELGLSSEGSLRARALRCRTKLKAFILEKDPSLTLY